VDREGLLNAGWLDNLIRAGRLEPGERVLVVVDSPLVAEGRQLAAAARGAGAQARLALWAGVRPLHALPPGVASGSADADLVFFLAQAPRGDEAGTRVELMRTVSGRGGREIFLGFVDAELLAGQISRTMPDLEIPARALLEQLEGCEILRVRGAAGTDLTLRVAGRPWLTDALPLEPGKMANFPGGEVFVAPHSDGADGVLVVDLTVPYTVDGLVDAPVVLRFERGQVTSIEGGEAARLLRELVEKAGAGADVIAELGLGFNPTLTPRGHVMLDEKASNTAHVAIGANVAYGGDNESTIHVDCVFSQPTFEVDGVPLNLP
jgi:hypothetical protein